MILNNYKVNSIATRCLIHYKDNRINQLLVFILSYYFVKFYQI